MSTKSGPQKKPMSVLSILGIIAAFIIFCCIGLLILASFIPKTSDTTIAPTRSVVTATSLEAGLHATASSIVRITDRVDLTEISPSSTSAATLTPAPSATQVIPATATVAPTETPVPTVVPIETTTPTLTPTIDPTTIPASFSSLGVLASRVQNELTRMGFVFDPAVPDTTISGLSSVHGNRSDHRGYADLNVFNGQLEDISVIVDEDVVNPDLARLEANTVYISKTFEIISPPWPNAMNWLTENLKQDILAVKVGSKKTEVIDMGSLNIGVGGLSGDSKTRPMMWIDIQDMDMVAKIFAPFGTATALAASANSPASTQAPPTQSVNVTLSVAPTSLQASSTSSAVTATPVPVPAVPQSGFNAKCSQSGAAQICASVSNASPQQNTIVTIYGRLLINGVGQTGLPMNTTWEYKGASSTCFGTTDSTGSASCGRDISRATKGYTVSVTVSIGDYSVTTSFTPN